MSYLDCRDIISNLDFIKQIDFFEILQPLNDHATLFLRGIVDEQGKDQCVKRADSQQMIQISLKNKRVLYTGIIQNIKVKVINQVYYVELQGISYSFLMDVKKINKSYQNVALTYEDILMEKKVLYPKGGVIDTVGIGVAINQLIVQFQETDWQFIKRLASHFNHPIVPAVRQEGVKLFFGIPSGKSIGELTNFNYEVERDISRYLISSANYNQELSEADTMEYTITTDQDFDLGDIASFQKIPLLIKRKQARYCDGVLIFTYQLAPKRGLSQDRIFCEAIQGASIKGKVLAAVGDQVKVHLEIDQEQESKTAWLFPYTTMYTAQGNTGWYCMPEIGDTVNIYFPGHVEAMAMAVSSVREGNAGSDKISDPGVKYFRTADGKELKFAQDEVLITCVNGKDQKTGEMRVVYIRLNQNSGIEIISTEAIQIKSDKEITLKAEEAIKVLAEEQITLSCKTSEIRIDSMVDICGEVIKVN